MRIKNIGANSLPVLTIKETNNMKPYVYILIRKDLPNTQRVVQACHVAWEVSKKHKLEVHPSVIMLGMNNLTHLQNQKQRLISQGLEVVEFSEPLFNNEVTALGILVTTESQRQCFKKYQLLSDTSFYSSKDQGQLSLKACNHSSNRLDLVETLAFEYTPKRVCTRCFHHLGKPLSDQEKKQAVKSFYQQVLESNISEEELEAKKNGFNL